jgi:hypothetical protein
VFHVKGAKVMCNKCQGVGVVIVSLADPENGPTDDPADEIGVEYCDCQAGTDKWYQDVTEYERAEKEWFASLVPDSSNEEAVSLRHLE